MQPGKMHEMVKPLSWLIGTWKANSVKVKKKMNFPMFALCPQFKAKNMKKYNELITFSTSGQPNLKFEATAWDAKSYFPLKLEVGHLTVHEDGEHATLVSALNYGMAAIEVGKIRCDCLELCTLTVCNSEVQPLWVYSFCRVFQLDDIGQLVYKFKIHTEEEARPVDYLSIIYEKVVTQ